MTKNKRERNKIKREKKLKTNVSKMVDESEKMK